MVGRTTQGHRGGTDGTTPETAPLVLLGLDFHREHSFPRSPAEPYHPLAARDMRDRGFFEEVAALALRRVAS
jgi:hypothetical protein